MSDDLMEKVEALLAYKLPEETFTLTVKDKAVFNQLKNAASILKLVPQLVAEVKRWRQIATEAKAEAIFLNEDPDHYYAGWDDRQDQAHYRKQAAKELDLQVSQEAGYVGRLEAAHE